MVRAVYRTYVPQGVNENKWNKCAANDNILLNRGQFKKEVVKKGKKKHEKPAKIYAMELKLYTLQFAKNADRRKERMVAKNGNQSRSLPDGAGDVIDHDEQQSNEFDEQQLNELDDVQAGALGNHDEMDKDEIDEDENENEEEKNAIDATPSMSKLYLHVCFIVLCIDCMFFFG